MRWGVGWTWEFEVSRWKLLHLEWINNEALLYGTGSYSQSLEIDNERKGMYIYVWLGHFACALFLYSLGKYPEVGWLDQMVVLFLLSEESAHWFPQWQHQFTFPQIAQEGSLFSTSSPKLVISCFFDKSHSNRPWGKGGKFQMSNDRGTSFFQKKCFMKKGAKNV